MTDGRSGEPPAERRAGRVRWSDRAEGFPVLFPVVALIASAGGLDALTRVLAPLPADLPAAILVALHQEPDRISMLADILQRSTSLTVTMAQEDTAMRPGVALVVPPGRHLLVTSQGWIGLIDAGEVPPARPSGDLLLATLAVTCGPRALAIVLTGNGRDAQAGARAIVHCGGTVLAQDEASSRFFAMPAATIATDTVSQVLGVDDIAEAIISHTLTA